MVRKTELFQKNLRYLREAKGFSFRELARESGVPFSTISTIERGADPNLGTAQAIAVALGKTLDQMVTIDYEAESMRIRR